MPVLKYLDLGCTAALSALTVFSLVSFQYGKENRLYRCRFLFIFGLLLALGTKILIAPAVKEEQKKTVSQQKLEQEELARSLTELSEQLKKSHEKEKAELKNNSAPAAQQSYRPDDNTKTMHETFHTESSEVYPLKLDLKNLRFGDMQVSEAKDVIRMFQKHKKPTPKSDFETEKAYEERYNKSYNGIGGAGIYYLLRQESTQPIEHSANLALPVNWLQYDAEEQSFNLKLENWYVALNEEEKTPVKRIGTNAFGVVEEYEEQSKVQYQLRLNYSHRADIHLPMPAATAKEQAPNLAVLFLVDFIEAPYWETYTNKETATLQRPVEENIDVVEIRADLKRILIVNWKTKQILVNYDYKTGKAK